MVVWHKEVSTGVCTLFKLKLNEPFKCQPGLVCHSNICDAELYQTKIKLGYHWICTFWILTAQDIFSGLFLVTFKDIR